MLPGALGCQFHVFKVLYSLFRNGHEVAFPTVPADNEPAAKQKIKQKKRECRKMPVERVSTKRNKKVSKAVRDRIVLEHLPLVKAIAVRVHENLPVHVDVDDLFH